LILGFLGGGPTNIRSNYLLIKGIDAIGVRIGEFSRTGPTGGEIRATGQVFELRCSGRSRCPITFDVGMGVKSSVTTPVDVSWTLEVRYVVPAGEAVPAEAQLLVEAVPAPN